MTLDRSRAGLLARLQVRHPEIEQAILTRVYGISDPAEAADPGYVEGLRAAVFAAIDYGLASIESGGRHSQSIPPALLIQARVAARNGVSLDTVLRRYFAGYTLLADFLMQEIEAGDLLQSTALKHLLGGQAKLFDRLIAAVTEEYTRELEGRLGDSTEERRVERVKRLLSGELIDTSELAYELDAHHLGAIAAGPGAPEALRNLATALDRRLLLVRRGEGTVWAWLGGRRRTDPAELERKVSESWPGLLSFAVGEPAQGLAGWRLTHRQARAALPIALRRSRSFVRYADVALLASMFQDDLLATSLRQLYLEPLAEERDGGETLRETLRAYFAAERNVSSAAAALSVNRHTVTSRLRTIEKRLGRPLSTCATEIDAALRLEDLGHPTLPHVLDSKGLDATDAR
jgi:hypothetical protein